MPTADGETAADPKRWLLGGAITAIAVICAWLLFASPPALVVAEPDATVAIPTAATTPVATAAAEIVAPAPSPDPVRGAPAHEVAAAPAVNANDAATSATTATVPNRLGLAVDELVRAGLAQDVAEDLVETLNSMALCLERFPFAAAHAEEEFVLLSVVPKLPAAVAKGDVTIERVDSVGAAVIVEGGVGVTAGCYCDGIELVYSARRGHLRITVPARAAAPAAWQRYVAKWGAKPGWSSMATARAGQRKER